MLVAYGFSRPFLALVGQVRKRVLAHSMASFRNNAHACGRSGRKFMGDEYIHGMLAPSARVRMIEEVGSGKPHAGICAGASGNRCLYCDA